MKKVKLLLIMLAMSLANYAQSNDETMKVETFTEYPSEIDGGSCAFYLNKSDKDKGCFFMVNDLCNTAYIKINGKMEVLKMENTSTESPVKYSNSSYILTIISSENKDTTDESYTLKGKIKVENSKGETINFPFIGECGC